MKPGKTVSSKATIRFSAELSGASVVIPKTASSKLPSGKTTIEGVINSLPFQSAAIQPDSKGNQMLKLTPAMQKAAERDGGKTVTIEITRVGDEPETRVPVEFSRALASSPKASAIWNDITPIARRDWIFWIITVKKEETREVRVKKGISKLSGGMRRVCCFAGINWLMKNS